MTDAKDLQTCLYQYKLKHNSDPSYGSSGTRYLNEVSLIIETLRPDFVLDFGCGKGALINELKTIFPTISFEGYDPAISLNNTIKRTYYDLILCTDVLEHIPVDQLDNILLTISKLSKQCFFVLHHYPASNLLPNGENAHCTIKPPSWYYSKLDMYFKDIIALPSRGTFNSVVITFKIPPHIIQKYLDITDNRLDLKLKKCEDRIQQLVYENRKYIKQINLLDSKILCLESNFTNLVELIKHKNLFVELEEFTNSYDNKSINIQNGNSFLESEKIKILSDLIFRQTIHSYDKIYNILMNSFMISHTFKWKFFELYILFIFEHGDIYHNLLSIFEKYENELTLWTKKTVLLFISYCIYLCRHKEFSSENKIIFSNLAKRYILYFVDQYGLNDIAHWLPVSGFAVETGIVSSDEVKLSASIWSRFSNLQHCLKKIIQSDSVAVVGNGPQERGTGNGKVIDSFEYVIRFNSYNLNILDKNDYGEKTDIWINCLPLPDDISTKGNVNNIFFFFHFFSRPSLFLFNKFDIYQNKNFYYIDMYELYNQIYNSVKIYTPSNGFSTIFLIKKFYKYFSSKNCFGMSFKQIIDENYQYIDNTTGNIFQSKHNMKLEQQAINNLFEITPD